MDRLKLDAPALGISSKDGEKERAADDSLVEFGDMERRFGRPVLARIPWGPGFSADRPLRFLRYNRRR